MDVLTTSQAGLLLRNNRTGKLGVTRQRVYAMIRDGIFNRARLIEMPTGYLIPRSEVVRVNRLKRPQGRKPRKAKR